MFIFWLAVARGFACTTGACTDKKRCKFKSWLVMVGSAASATICSCLLAWLVLGIGIGIRSDKNQSVITDSHDQFSSNRGSTA